MSETRNPVGTLKVAAPAALILVSILYLLTNVAYFAAISKEDIADSGRILAATFFRNMFGERAERAMSVFVALSAFGNVLAVIFSQGRIVQELGREGILPLSKLFSSNKPLNAPFMGLFEHWAVSVIIMLAPPPGDAYNFLLNVISYPLSVVNTFVSLGLIIIYLNRHKYPDFNPKIRATLPVVVFFFLSSVYLIAAPFVPPSDPSQNVYTSLPYYLHAVVGIAIFGVGAVYWVIWAHILPSLGKYRLVRSTIVGDDGWSRNLIKKEYNESVLDVEYSEK